MVDNRTPEERWSRVMTEVARHGAAGAATLREFTGHYVVMADPEVNEFCVAGSVVHPSLPVALGG